MKAGDYGLVLFAVGSAILLVFSPLYSPDLALVPPQPVNSPRFTSFYYVPRVAISGVLLSESGSYDLYRILLREGQVLGLWHDRRRSRNLGILAQRLIICDHFASNGASPGTPSPADQSRCRGF